jgi:hypothetical protein
MFFHFQSQVPEDKGWKEVEEPTSGVWRPGLLDAMQAAVRTNWCIGSSPLHNLFQSNF